jgi:hypothetical protein
MKFSFVIMPLSSESHILSTSAQWVSSMIMPPSTSSRLAFLIRPSLSMSNYSKAISNF